MRKSLIAFSLIFCFALSVNAASKIALVGGTLIDGNGTKPIRNSVIVIEGERITAVGQLGTLAIPADAQVISTEGMSVLPDCGTCMCI